MSLVNSAIFFVVIGVSLLTVYGIRFAIKRLDASNIINIHQVQIINMERILDILGNIGFDWHVALANIVNFLVIFFVLKKFAFGPIKKVLSDRVEKIRTGVENATRAETALTMAGEERKRILLDADTKASGIVSSAHKSGEDVIVAAKTTAEAEAESILEKNRAKLLREKKEMEREVNGKIIDVVLMGVEKVLREEIDHERGEKLIRRMLAEQT